SLCASSPSTTLVVTARNAFRAVTTNVVEGEEAQRLVKLIDMLEDLDDVQEVYHNAEIPDSAYA
ncbi:MAG TPA: hypothetical protein ENM98_02600, partial [Halothiobacillaceae bacterium]|nr:hypothetical protein [Halothiobacillaceae bacterium]